MQPGNGTSPLVESFELSSLEDWQILGVWQILPRPMKLLVGAVTANLLHT
jgi:hypothetical protein